MLEAADAALVIGDPALYLDTDVPRLDLGEEWQRRTGLPFVYAFWAGPPRRADRRRRRCACSGRSARAWPRSTASPRATTATGRAGRRRGPAPGHERLLPAVERAVLSGRGGAAGPHRSSTGGPSPSASSPDFRSCASMARSRTSGPRSSRGRGSPARKASPSCATPTLLDLGQLADAVRWRLHPEPLVTYIIDRNINYTNVCTAQCAFCAFYRDLPSKEGYVLTKAQLTEKIEETIDLGRPPDPAPGRPAPRPRHRVLRGALPLDEGHLAAALDPRPVPGGGEAHRAGVEPRHRRGPAAPDGRRPRFDPRGRRRGAVRPRPPRHRHRQGDDGGLAVR